MAGLSIYAKLSKITEDLKDIDASKDVGTGEKAYSVSTWNDVIKAVKELETDNRVYSYPATRATVDQGFTEINGVKVYFAVIKTVYRFVNIDNPTEAITMESMAEGRGFNAIAKAQTLCDKYALLKAYKGVSQEMFDEEEPEEDKVEKDAG